MVRALLLLVLVACSRDRRVQCRVREYLVQHDVAWMGSGSHRRYGTRPKAPIGLILIH
jgi:hypothetical protein